jgi:hypothetical protein
MEKNKMSALDFDDKAMVAILAGTIAIVGAVQWFSSAKAESAEPARIYRVASVQKPAPQPHYAITYTFAPLSKECRADVIAAKNKARCEAEFNRQPIREDVDLIITPPGSSYAALTR